MINFLYTNIGRGHPFYLDGIVELLQNQSKLKFKTYDVFEISRGVSLKAWEMARLMYKIGSTDSLVGKWYNRFRDKTEYHKKSLPMELMGRDIRKQFIGDDTPLVVDHPVLVGLLRGKKNLIYQHGEIAVPPQAIVRGADYILVPIESSAETFIRAGYKKEQIIVTGLCVEPRLARYAATNLEGRLERYNSERPLCGAFYSSGAEPNPHVEKIQAALKSVFESGGHSFVYAQKSGRLAEAAGKAVEVMATTLGICNYETRAELDELTFRDFHRFDYLVSPSHERTNWALGLGLPMFILEPAIGPFAPMNQKTLLDSGAAESIESEIEVKNFAKRLEDLRKSGKLAKMARTGWDKYAINGFRTIADFLLNKYAVNS